MIMNKTKIWSMAKHAFIYMAMAIDIAIDVQPPEDYTFVSLHPSFLLQ